MWERRLYWLKPVSEKDRKRSYGKLTRRGHGTLVPPAAGSRVNATVEVIFASHSHTVSSAMLLRFCDSFQSFADSLARVMFFLIAYVRSHPFEVFGAEADDAVARLPC